MDGDTDEGVEGCVSEDAIIDEVATKVLFEGVGTVEDELEEDSVELDGWIEGCCAGKLLVCAGMEELVVTDLEVGGDTWDEEGGEEKQASR